MESVNHTGISEGLEVQNKNPTKGGAWIFSETVAYSILIKFHMKGT